MSFKRTGLLIPWIYGSDASTMCRRQVWQRHQVSTELEHIVTSAVGQLRKDSNKYFILTCYSWKLLKPFFCYYIFKSYLAPSSWWTVEVSNSRLMSGLVTLYLVEPLLTCLSVKRVWYSMLLVLGNICLTIRSMSWNLRTWTKGLEYLWLCTYGMFCVATCHIHRTGLPSVVVWLPDCNWDKFTFHRVNG